MSKTVLYAGLQSASCVCSCGVRWQNSWRQALQTIPLLLLTYVLYSVTLLVYYWQH